MEIQSVLCCAVPFELLHVSLLICFVLFFFTDWAFWLTLKYKPEFRFRWEKNKQTKNTEKLQLSLETNAFSVRRADILKLVFFERKWEVSTCEKDLKKPIHGKVGTNFNGSKFI